MYYAQLIVHCAVCGPCCIRRSPRAAPQEFASSESNPVPRMDPDIGFGFLTVDLRAHAQNSTLCPIPYTRTRRFNSRSRLLAVAPIHVLATGKYYVLCIRFRAVTGQRSEVNCVEQ